MASEISHLAMAGDMSAFSHRRAKQVGAGGRWWMGCAGRVGSLRSRRVNFLFSRPLWTGLGRRAGSLRSSYPSETGQVNA